MDRDMFTFTSLKNAGYIKEGMYVNEDMKDVNAPAKFLFTKTISDSVGIKYFIKVWATFVKNKLDYHFGAKFMYTPEVIFYDDSGNSLISVSLRQTCFALDNVNSMEMFIENMWHVMKFGYYKKT